ncbi:short-chain dehydrogenase [Polyplosphaeria fusca]|uniref:Short-chain dehydrogenase n=1 Tax=Polyplosphaeria fusca TaxID=682080 RepID=A0A9P4UU61_9PLEO|nr:short-chain dehydrogenase [Polyplosphaeria fusca]
MEGTVIITGANGTLAAHAVAYLLDKYPNYTAILLVRDASEEDVNTQALRAAISLRPQATAVISEVDLARLDSVQDFANGLVTSIRNGTYPAIVAVICNAFWWNLAVDAPELTSDGYEKTMQIGHIAHASLILRLLKQFDPNSGCVVTLSSEAHEPGKAVWEKIPPEIPENIEDLVKPPQAPDYSGRPFQRYANSKLVTVMWTHALNRHLEQDSNLSKITAVAMDPGWLVDSRALTTNTTAIHVNAQRFFFRPLRPLISLLNPAVRSAAAAAPGLIDLALRRAHGGERGHFKLLTKEEGSPASLDVEKQELLWTKTIEWAHLTSENATLLNGE